jgi:TusA-related sulfurtransferase
MSRVALVQYDNRSDQDLGYMCDLIKLNADYAKKHGYTHIFNRDRHDLPPYWVKVFIVLDALKQGFDIVVWLDSDAVVHDFDRKIESFFEGYESFIYASDCGTWPEFFNAGIFFVKKSATPIVEDWAALYDKTMWVNDNNFWRHCKGRWAGEAFEQGSFIDNIIPKYEKVLKKIDWRIIQCPYPIPESFVVHFAGQFRSNASMYSHLNKEKTYG